MSALWICLAVKQCVCVCVCVRVKVCVREYRFLRWHRYVCLSIRGCLYCGSRVLSGEECCGEKREKKKKRLLKSGPTKYERDNELPGWNRAFESQIVKTSLLNLEYFNALFLFHGDLFIHVSCSFLTDGTFSWWEIVLWYFLNDPTKIRSHAGVNARIPEIERKIGPSWSSSG